MDTTATIVMVAIVVGVVMVGTFYSTGKKALAIFPHLGAVNVLYRDKMATGYAGKGSAMNASKSLEVVVTDQEFWIRGSAFFAGVLAKHDLIHKIPLRNVKRVNADGNKVEVSFKTNSGSNKQVNINTRNGVAFSRALKKK